MLEQLFNKLYLMFRANFYRQFVHEIGTREGSLSATESYCVELIYLMANPTISDFANYLDISVPNAHYKINSLVNKGYIVRQTSEVDRREQHLIVTEKFLKYYGLNDKVISQLMKSIRENFTQDEVNIYIDMLDRVITLMEQIKLKEETI